MRFLVVLSLSLAIPLTASAEDPLQCVDPVFREGLFGFYGGPSTYSTMLPPGFPALDFPDEFDLIGSSVRNDYQNIAYHQAGDALAAGEVVVATLQDNGWTALEQDEAVPRGGFVTKTHRNPTIARTFCRDGDRPLSVVYRPSSMDGTWINISRHRGATSTCAELIAQRQQHRAHFPMTMPTLVLPDDVEHGGNTGFSGGNNESSTSAEFRTAMNIAETGFHFSRQLLNQGWVKEGEWSGTSSAGGAWMSSDESKFLLVTVMQNSSGKTIARMAQMARNR